MPQDDSRWATLYIKQRADAITCANVYLDDFISILQGGPQEQTQMTRHIFTMVDKVFRPNTPEDTHRKEPIYVKKLCQGGAAWSTKKIIL